MERRIGLLGGTFDPPHLGHLWLAETARQQLQLEKILFLPAGQPIHKLENTVSDSVHRLAMLQLALVGSPHLMIDKTDMDRPPPHTTFTLLPLLEASYPGARFWLLMGSDSLRDLATWRRPQQVVAQCRLAVLPRPGVKLSWKALEAAIPGIKGSVDLLDGPTLGINSTDIRRWARSGHSLRYLLPPAVLDYIAGTNLYRHST